MAMAIRRSPEIESVMRRVWSAWQAGDMAVISNLFAHTPNLLAIGSDSEEWWVGGAEFLRVRDKQAHEMPDFDIVIHEVLAFESGDIGWAGVLMTMTTPAMSSVLRTTAVLQIEDGVWRIVQWHNSLPVTNEQMFGVGLTTSLDELLASIGDEDAARLAEEAHEGMASLMFTDIVDSTPLAEARGDREWTRMVSVHEDTIRAVARDHDGRVVKMLGDGAMITFQSVRAAVRAGVGIQLLVEGGEMRVRIGIHAGEVVRRADDLIGTTVNKAARIAAAAGGGETLISSTVRDLMGTMPEIEVGRPRVLALKGLPDTHQVFPVTRAAAGPADS